MHPHPIEIHTVPCLDDNYAFVIHNQANGEAVVIDVPDAAPILDKLSELDAQLRAVVLTHHHWDHVDGLPALKSALGYDGSTKPFQVMGAKADAPRLPDLDVSVAEGDVLPILGFDAHILDVSGHTVGHIALHMPQIEALFTADSLMAMGCGRLFEGTPHQMWDSLQKLRALPEETIVYSGHEYMAGNMAFALSLGEDNEDLANRADLVSAMRDQGLATVPSMLGTEMATNPFLRADHPALMAAVGMADATPGDVFTEIRRRKDNF